MKRTLAYLLITFHVATAAMFAHGSLMTAAPQPTRMHEHAAHMPTMSHEVPSGALVAGAAHCGDHAAPPVAPGHATCAMQDVCCYLCCTFCVSVPAVAGEIGATENTVFPDTSMTPPSGHFFAIFHPPKR